MSKYTISGKTIEFSDAEERFIDLQKCLLKDLAKAEDVFLEFYSQCGSIETVLKRYTDMADDIWTGAAERHFYSLGEYGITDVTKKDYMDYMNDCFDITDSAHSVVLDEFSKITDETEKAAAMRSKRKESRGRAEDYGLAEKGSAAAEAINAGTGILHSAINLVGNAASAVGAGIDKLTLYADTKAREVLLNGICKALEAECSLYQRFVEEKTGSKYFENKFDKTRGEALAESARLLKGEDGKETAVRAMTLYPFNNVPYEYIISTYGDSDNAVQDMAERCCPFADIKKFKAELVKGRIQTADYSSKESVVTASEEVSTLCSDLGISADVYTDPLKKIISRYEAIDLKVDGFNYETKEQADNARRERDIMDKTLLSYTVNDEKPLLELRENIEKNFTSLSRSKYLDFVDTELKAYDLRYRTVNEKVYETREEADTVRAQIRELAGMISDIQINSAEDAAALKNKAEAAAPAEINAPYLERCGVIADVYGHAEEFYNKYRDNITGTRADQTLVLAEAQSIIDKLSRVNVRNDEMFNYLNGEIEAFKTVMNKTYPNVIEATDAYYAGLEKAYKYKEYLDQKSEKKSFFGKLKETVQGVAAMFNEASYNYFSEKGTRDLPVYDQSEWTDDVRDDCESFVEDAEMFAENQDGITKALLTTYDIPTAAVHVEGLLLPDEEMTEGEISKALSGILDSAEGIKFEPAPAWKQESKDILPQDDEKSFSINKLLSEFSLEK